MNMEALMGVIRHILTFGGGFLVAKGLVDEETMLQAVAALATLIGLGWSIFAKKKPAA
jgi:hypothetical protein